VKIEIFNSSGTLLKTIETRMNPEGYKSDPIEWDGRTDAGGLIGRGFYIYRVVVRAEDGSTQQDQSKLVYVRQ
jgi:flagellar hook assembly protein FlgD